MKKKFYAVLSLVVLSAGAFAQVADSASFNFTGGIQTFTVPCGVTSLEVRTWGAQGGSGATGNSSTGVTPGGAGGTGAYVTGTLAVTPGQILNIFVGGQGATPAGGFNGGANGGSQNAGGGGGASDIRVNGTAEADRVITAGGGGGGGRGGCESQVAIAGGNGGNGNGGVGTNGQDAPTSGGAAGGGRGGNFGAVVGAAGPAGIGCSGFLGSPGGTATTGTGAAGGAGQSCCCFSFGSIPGGGGGGGGQLGGGGGGGGSAGTSGCSGNDKGAGGGGGGGSSYFGGVTNGVVVNDTHTGDGMVQVLWTVPVPPAHAITGTLTLCQNDSASYSIPSDVYSTFYTWTVSGGLTFVSGQNTTNIQIAAPTAGTYTVTVMGVNGTCTLNGPVDSVVITVNPAPSVAATAASSSICIGASDTLTATGANNGYTWLPGNLTGSSVVITPTATTTYTVVGTDSLGCINETTVSVSVNQLPTVTFSTQSSICLADDTLSLSGSPVGGTFSGNGVNGTSFSPSVAGVGTQAITYSFTDVNGCSATATDSVTVSACTSINEINNPFSVTMMPNPATEVLAVRWDANKAKVNTLEVFDNTGRLVLSQVVTNGSNAELNVSELPAGNYNLVVKTATGKATYSFMKK